MEKTIFHFDSFPINSIQSKHEIDLQSLRMHFRTSSNHCVKFKMLQKSLEIIKTETDKRAKFIQENKK